MHLRWVVLIFLFVFFRSYFRRNTACLARKKFIFYGLNNLMEMVSHQMVVKKWYCYQNMSDNLDCSIVLFIYQAVFATAGLKSLCVQRSQMFVWQIFAIENGNARSMWEQLGDHISILVPESYSHIDWSMYVFLFLCYGNLLFQYI